jgi:UDP-N-acetylmuramoyl-L-alanyl-D-glutamate--2,6-diaminopimelate ligase
MQTFAELISKLNPKIPIFQITGITSDSREVKPGYIFVAVAGTKQDGHDFLKIAEQSGALFLIGEKTITPLLAPYAKVSDARETLANLASAFYGHPSRNMLVIGVTGTSGKTTTAYLMESVLKACGKKTGVIGTINYRFGEKIYPSTHTTPGPVELQKLLAEMKNDGCDSVVMEVSSHALKQKRVEGILFSGAIFTGLSPEHLDFHPDMEDYFEAKAILFTHLLAPNGKATINTANEWGLKLLARFPHSSEFGHEQLNSTVHGIRGEIHGTEISSPLMGQFNCENIAGAVVLAQALGFSHAHIAQGVANLQVVPGRLENVSANGISVLVDYAHKPDALEKVLATLQKIAKKKIITVFGCGGDRDKSKRPKMGKIAVEKSSFVVITSDNPRGEEPEAIIQDILAGVHGHSNYAVEADRKKAIIKAISLAKPEDIVLIAGKGHENYQIIKGRKTHFDDREVARDALAKIR